MKLSKTGKFHISHGIMKKLKNNYYNKQGTLKPSGLWYSIGSKWLDFKLKESRTLIIFVSRLFYLQ